MNLSDWTYENTRGFPTEERFGLTNQVRRAAVSIPSNLAEGHAKDSTKDFLRHVSISLGSLAEWETQMMIAERRGFLPSGQLNDAMTRADTLGRMLRSLQIALRRRLSS